MRTFFLSILLFLLIPFCLYAEQTYQEQILDKAISEKIYKERDWYVLMHYKKPPARKIRSLVDDEKFFLSKNGKYDPKAELEATINAFFNKEISKDNDNNHPLCKFTGRREWLIERLNIDRSKLPQKKCTEYDEFYKKVDPTSVTLIFPFMYMKNPASMFGHTMLRINNSKNDPLTSYSVTFAASMPEDVNGFVYTFKGTFGGYFGYYKIKKYYDTLFEYGNVEKRDIWEYELNLSKAETIKLFNHLWEMNGIGSDYWFFDENCSYNMLLLLEAGRPSENLSVSIFWEAPTNTVKLIYSKGFVTDIKYRPSHLKLLENYSYGLSGKAVKLAQDVALNKLPPQAVTDSSYTESEKVAIFDFAIETMRFNFLQKKLLTVEMFDEYKKSTISLLSERAKIRKKTVHKVKEPVPPHKGHDITRIRFGAGVENFKEFYTEYGFKLGFHDLDDIDSGFIPNSQLTVLNVNLRWNMDTGRVFVKDAEFFTYGSYVPLTKMMQSISWKIEFGGDDRGFSRNRNFFTPYLRGGAGLTLSYDSFYFWLLGMTELSLAEGYDTYAGIGLGGSAGMSYSFKYGKLLAEGYYRYYVLGGMDDEAGFSGSYILPVTQNNSIELKYTYSNHWNIENQDLGLFWRFYF